MEMGYFERQRKEVKIDLAKLICPFAFEGLLANRSSDQHNARMETFCSQCNTPITCMPEAGCWCAELPNSLPVPNDKNEGCLCRDCLAKKLENSR